MIHILKKTIYLIVFFENVTRLINLIRKKISIQILEFETFVGEALVMDLNGASSMTFTRLIQIKLMPIKRSHYFYQFFIKLRKNDLFYFTI